MMIHTKYLCLMVRSVSLYKSIQHQVIQGVVANIDTGAKIKTIFVDVQVLYFHYISLHEIKWHLGVAKNEIGVITWTIFEEVHLGNCYMNKQNIQALR